MLNIEVQGRTAEDVVVKISRGGKPYASVGVAHMQGDGKVQWVDCVFFGTDSCNAINGIPKGTMVRVTGIPVISCYIAKDGKARGKQQILNGYLMVSPLELIKYRAKEMNVLPQSNDYVEQPEPREPEDVFPGGPPLPLETMPSPEMSNEDLPF